MTFDWSQYLNLAKELDGQATAPANQEAKSPAFFSWEKTKNEKNSDRTSPYHH